MNKKEHQKYNQALIKVAQKYPHLQRKALDKFIRRNQAFVMCVALPYVSTSDGHDELQDAISVINASVYYAIKSYDFNRGALFTSYWAYWIHGRISYWMKYGKGLFPPKQTDWVKQSYSPLGNEPDKSPFAIKYISEETFTGVSAGVGNERGVIGKFSISGGHTGQSLTSFFERWYGTNTQKKGRHGDVAKVRHMIKLYLIDGMSLDAISKIYGVTKERVRQIKAEHMPIFRKDLKNYINRLNGFN